MSRFRRALAAAAIALHAVVLVAARAAHAQGKDLDGVVNLNTAPPELLELLPGVGPAKVRSIVVYRLRRPFRTVDELVRIKGIGRKMVRRLRVHLAVSGPSTAHAVHRPPGTDGPPAVPLLAPRPPTVATSSTTPTRRLPAPPVAPLRPRPRVARSADDRRSTWAANHCARPP